MDEKIGFDLDQICGLIKYYYRNNETGGFLHIVLHDGNVDHSNVFWCMEQADAAGDTFGAFLAEQLMGVSESDLEALYKDDFWRMKSNESLTNTNPNV